MSSKEKNMGPILPGPALKGRDRGNGTLQRSWNEQSLSSLSTTGTDEARRAGSDVGV
jgi:hypothetical protein